MKRFLAAGLITFFLGGSFSFAQNTPKETIALETIGAMGGSTLYLSYISIGTLADGFEKKVYEKDQAIQLVNSVLNLLNVMKNYLEKGMSNGLFVGEDADFANKMTDCCNLLVIQAGHFVTYAKTGDRKYATEFDKARKQSWASIAKLLGFQN